MAMPNKLEEMQACLKLTSIKTILDGEVEQYSMVNIAGVAVRFSVPIPTRRSGTIS
jgi:hypothetical protein